MSGDGTFRSAVGRHRWGIVLAGGDGSRLLPLTRLICGDARPKQFCPLFGDETLLGRSLVRAETGIPREQILVSLTGHQREFFIEERRMRPSQRVVQPKNKGTAPPIIHGLLSIAAADSDAVVAVLPCDHHYGDEAAFTKELDSAFEAADCWPKSVIVLGAQSEHPEVEYGWIELGQAVPAAKSELFRVKGFQEKPQAARAAVLFARGDVWNTFVMVGSVSAFLGMIASTLPELIEHFGSFRLWDGGETNIEVAAYNAIPSTGFSHRVLEAAANRLLVQRLRNVGWSDLGDPARVISAIRTHSIRPRWLERWENRRAAHAAFAAAS